MERFVNKLGRVLVSAETRNPYAFNWTRANAARRHNLAVYLRETRRVQPAIALVGEALGYRGGGVSGVPFVSQTLLLTHQFYEGWDFRPISTDHPATEASSTILHGVCDAVGVQALHWNAFPFHPHRAGLPQTNRKPTAAELVQGGQLLVEMMALFEIEVIVAVGNSAEKSLTQLNIPHQKIRHPSYGGKQAFHTGLQAIAA